MYLIFDRIATECYLMECYLTFPIIVQRRERHRAMNKPPVNCKKYDKCKYHACFLETIKSGEMRIQS